MANPNKGLSGSDVKKIASEWHGIALTNERAESLAQELNGLNAATRAAAARLHYDDEPGAFKGAMSRLKRKAGA